MRAQRRADRKRIIADGLRKLKLSTGRLFPDFLETKEPGRIDKNGILGCSCTKASGMCTAHKLRANKHSDRQRGKRESQEEIDAGIAEFDPQGIHSDPCS